jgi:16S rRNA (cytidine1402-2'-O)-methyltransferase
MVTFNSQSGPQGFARVIALLKADKHVALVSDAGTPGLSDPGLELVSMVREVFGDGVTIETIPGPSALAAAVSVSGLRAPSFVFYGFLPLKKGREKLITTICADQRASVFFESPHRIMKTLDALQKHLDGTRRIGLFRELTKMHEESTVGTASEVLTHFTNNPDKQRGEFVVIVEAE